jgi:signal transduction histidine kinase/DNA-binding response OmpR family regulator
LLRFARKDTAGRRKDTAGCRKDTAGRRKDTTGCRHDTAGRRHVTGTHAMTADEPVNILMVDDQPAKLLSYEIILKGLNQNLIKADSAREALGVLLKTEVAVVLIDVCMPDLDGFELAAMIREHPRCQRTAIIFVSAILLSDMDRIKGYESGAVDYVPVPVVPELLRAKVRIFAELYRKTRLLEQLNADLELRVAERTREVEEAAKRLRESEQRRSLALAAGRMGSWDWDFGTGDIRWDHAEHAVFGTDPAQYQPTVDAILALVHPDDRDAVVTLHRQSASNGEAFNTEFRVIQPNGALRWCAVAGAPTIGADGQSVRLSGVTLDITESKLAADALARANVDLEQRIAERTREREAALAQLHEMQKMESLGQLTGGIAHDFNNLLMVVLGNLEMLRKHLPEDPRLSRMVDRAIQGAERGASLTKRMLAFARRQQLRPEAVDVPKLVDSIHEMLTRSIGGTIAIRTRFETGLPTTLVDPNQLELALLNLVLNCRDAMPDGGEITIAVRHRAGTAELPADLPSGSYIGIAVTDTGAGMDELTLKRATEPFFTSKEVGKGTGLGLSMVHGLAAQSGGTLRIRSAPGEGTTVEVWLPTTDQAAAAAQEAAKPPPDETGPLRVLLVDDDVLVMGGTASLLEDLGHRVIEASSGARALDALRSDAKVDIVVTDYAMAGMTGAQLAREIRRQWPGVPVIMATGYAVLPDDEASHHHILNKPFTQRDLAEAINAVTRRNSNLVYLDRARRG